MSTGLNLRFKHSRLSEDQRPTPLGRYITAGSADVVGLRVALGASDEVGHPSRLHAEIHLGDRNGCRQLFSGIKDSWRRGAGGPGAEREGIRQSAT